MTCNYYGIGVLYQEINFAMNKDGFTEVRRRGRKASREYRSHPTPRRPQAPTDKSREDYAGPEVPLLVEKIGECRQKLKTTQFYTDLFGLLTSLQLQCLTVVCYGIGHIGTCHIARHQFVLLLELIEFYKPNATWVFDPVLHTEEETVIRLCGCQMFTQNQLCKYSVEEETLFFMPHCGKAMYNNLLWANWSTPQLSKIAIIGNSFNSYREKLTSTTLLKEARYVYHIHEASKESPLPTSYPDSTVFNDTSLHIFPLDKLVTLDKTLWANSPEPVIDPSDSEIIS